jgi:hypothetical protein
VNIYGVTGIAQHLTVIGTSIHESAQKGAHYEKIEFSKDILGLYLCLLRGNSILHTLRTLDLKFVHAEVHLQAKGSFTPAADGD